MGRPKRKRLLGSAGDELGDTDQTAAASLSAPSGSGEAEKNSNSKSSTSRKRARRNKKKRKQKKARQKKAERRKREDENECTGKLPREFSFLPAHTWHSDPNGKCETTGSKASKMPHPRDCYDESKSTLQDNRNLIFHSWINELSWFRHDEKICAPSSGPSILAHDEHVRTLMEQLESIKERMWPAALRCASGYNAINFGQRTAEAEFVEARRACNHFEWTGEGQRDGLNKDLFVNRSAIKLANIDALLDFALVAEDSMTFVDLCGAPGGWSEYIMHRCKNKGVRVRGYGMSLIGGNDNGRGIDWKLDHIGMNGGDSSSSSSSFEIHAGADGTGDVYNWVNIASLHEVIANEQGKGTVKEANKVQSAERKPGTVDLVVADGGFDEQRNSTQQEALAQKLVTAQAAAAFELLRPGGTFVVKMFGCQTAEMRNLVRYLSVHFDRLTFLKPISSRPASAERYLICCSFAGVSPSWNGQAWSKSILSQNMQKGNNENESDSLLGYLDRVDADITRLNIKACSSILSYLENKAHIVEAGSDDEEGEVASSYRSVVSTLAYKYAWMLRS